MRNLRDVLEDQFGLDLTGWTLDEAKSISADGLVIVGLGHNASGFDEGWIAIIPEPSTALLLCAGLVTLAVERKRMRIDARKRER